MPNGLKEETGRRKIRKPELEGSAIFYAIVRTTQLRLERLASAFGSSFAEQHGSFLGLKAPPSPQHRPLRLPEVAMASEEIGKMPEWVMERQKALQRVHKLTHLKGPRDKITSVIIPGVLAATGLSLMGRGLYHLATGQGVKE